MRNCQLLQNSSIQVVGQSVIQLLVIRFATIRCAVSAAPLDTQPAALPLEDVCSLSLSVCLTRALMKGLSVVFYTDELYWHSARCLHNCNECRKVPTC